MGDVPSPDPARIAEEILSDGYLHISQQEILARAYLDLREAAQALVVGFDADTPIFTQQVYADLCRVLAGGSR